MSERDPLDVAIGTEIRNRRKAAGLSLAALGETIGVTYQQIQKYEMGANRVSAASLIRLDNVLPGVALGIVEITIGADEEASGFREGRDRIALDRLVAQLKAASPERRAQLLEGFCLIASAVPDGADAVVATIVDRRAA